MADFISRSTSKMQNGPKKSGRKARRPVTPGKSKAKTGRELWMNAVKKRQALNLSNTYRPGSPRHKTPTEYFVDTLRKTGVGMSSETNKSQSMTGLPRGNDNFYPYMSTSHYMRQVMGVERGTRGDDPTARPNAGTPSYKTPEEYYDEVLGLRKQIAALNHEASTNKTRIRRLEEDNQKKEKEIEGLLNPGKNKELRRTLGDRGADSAAVVHSLKQKVLKLEMQLRDKESTYCKLQADLKTTKIDEMRVQLEALYAEVMRLQMSKETGVEKSKSSGENSAKVKALSETVIRLSRTNEQLQAENSSLKDDLNRAMQDSDAKLDVKREYADMNRSQLLATISRLEKKLDSGDTMSVFSEEEGPRKQGKIELQGSVQDRLEQLDQRETELLDEVHKMKTLLRRSRDRKNDDNASLPPTPRRRQSRAVEEGSSSSRPGTGGRPMSASRRSSRMDESGSRPTSSRSREGRVEQFKQNRAASTIQSQWRRRREVEAFRENRAAKKIQHEWMDYKHRHYDEDLDDAAYTIQATLKGHHTRRQRMRDWRNEDYDTSSISETDDGIYLIQSSLRGHRVRQDQLRNMRRNYIDDDDDDSVLSYGRRRTSPTQRPSSAQRHLGRPSSSSRPGSATRPGSGSRPGSRPSSAHRRSSASMMSKRGSTSHMFKAQYEVPTPSYLDTEEDDDNDIMF